MLLLFALATTSGGRSPAWLLIRFLFQQCRHGWRRWAAGVWLQAPMGYRRRGWRSSFHGCVRFGQNGHKNAYYATFKVVEGSTLGRLLGCRNSSNVAREEGRTMCGVGWCSCNNLRTGDGKLCVSIE